MTVDILSTVRKAQSINLDKTRYGTFAEIGAGQEVARHFFQAGHASQTVAKTMSAYDKTFSDEIYGKGSRFVSQERLMKMLEHEYALLEARLSAQRGADTCFFAFANTVVTTSHDDKGRSHCWMGLRFQTKPQSQPQDIILHVRMLDRLRLMQQEALGVLGVNLLFAAFYLVDLETEFVASLVENIGFDRLEIDFLKFSGDALKHIDNNRLSLELVRQGLTKSVMFSPEGEALLAADTLYGKPVVVQKGTFRPIINTNVQILEKGLEQVQKVTSKAPLVCFEVSISKFYEKESGVAEEQWDVPDILARVQTIGALGYHVMVSKYALYSSLKKHLRRCTSEEIIFFIGADSLDKLLDSQVYEEYPGGLLGAMGQLFDKNTRVYVYPYKTKALCLTAKTFSPSPQQQSLYRYFLENHYLEDILGCDEVDSSIRSDDVRDMLAQGNKEWEKHVPEPVCQLIKEKKFFGYKEK